MLFVISIARLTMFSGWIAKDNEYTRAGIFVWQTLYSIFLIVLVTLRYNSVFELLKELVAILVNAYFAFVISKYMTWSNKPSE